MSQVRHPRVPLRAAVLCALLSLFSFLASGQTVYGVLNGKVLDPSGAIVPGASVQVTNLDTGDERRVESDGSGYYRVPSLAVGRYSLEYSKQGFERLIRQPIQVNAAVERTIDVSLVTGSNTEVVSVVAEAPPIEATQAQLTKQVEARRILELPGLNSLNGLALLQPGALPNNNGRPGSGFSINGGRTRSNNFTIDGANNNDQSLATPRQNVAPEFLGQFSIITNNFSAEAGRNSGSVVNQLTRSGTNGFHGTLRYGWEGNGYNALTTDQQRTFNAQKALGRSDYLSLRAARPVQVSQNYVLSGGGPIIRNRLFFFTGYQRNFFRTTAVPTTVAISPAGFGTLRANATLFAPGVIDYLERTFLVANDPTAHGSVSIPVSGGSPLSIPIQQFNRGLTGALSYGTNSHQGLQKVDAHISDSDNLSVRYLIDDSFDPGSPASIAGNEVGAAGRNQSATVNYARVFSATVVNEARATYGRRSLSFPENLPPAVTIGGFNSIGSASFPQFRTDNLYEFSDNLSITRGNHTMRVGGLFLRYQLNSFFAPSFRGIVTYNSLADLLYDRSASYDQYAGTGTVPARTSEVSGYFQDDWRVRPSLTLNLGLRYEFTGAPFGFFSNAKPDVNNLGPRFGFAYAPRDLGGPLGWLLGNGTGVLRGGYSLAYDQIFQNILLNNARNYPRGVNVNLTDLTGQRLFVSANRPVAPTPEDFIRLGGNPDTLGVRLYSPNKRVKQPYSQQYSLGIERQVLADYVMKVFYVGSRAIGLVREVESNIGFTAAAVDANPSVYAGILPSLQPIRNAQGQVTSYRRDPTRGSVLVGDALAQSTYHSLQATLERRYSNGLQFEVNYTYSSFINDSDDILGGTTNNTLPAVPFNFQLDRGRSGFDVPHRLVANYVYEFPQSFNSNPVLRRVLGGWQLSGVTTLASGTPYTILNSNNALGILPGQIATVAGSQRASLNLSGAPMTATSAGVVDPRFIANPQNSGIVGSVGRNTERTGGTINFNAALVKNMPAFGENQSLQLRWEAFNVFNHRNFVAIPTSTVTNSTNLTQFQNLGFTSVGGRSMILMARYLF